ncbi:MAG TPA: methionine--tRNA ligase, partial [Thermofilaceae archaeon]|nr:methionine--tRNA ligase [Thermofilaceae archaeon]
MVFSAWPYVNAIPHLGNLIGSVLSADIAARFLRMRGAEVVFASGSDQHGTPVEVEAIKRGVDPKVLADEMHSIVKELFEKWMISFDIYSKTENPVHVKFVREFYRKVYENGYIFDDVVQLLYCPKDEIFLPDRFVEGTCPYCGYPRARGDQCDSCGRLLDPLMLIEPRCVVCGSKPVVRESRHWFFDLPKLAEKLREYIEGNPHFPDNARNMSLQMIREGLKPRSLTRDNKWGIPAPFPGSEGKTIYVWMEAVLGYVSAVKEYFERRGEPGKWREFWLDESTRSVYFIGKDNIPFHTIIFPALLMASGEGYVLPWTVASTEYLMFEGDKFSKSRGIGIWIDEALELLPVDYWRFALVALRPEVRDVNFTWKSFEEVVNSLMNDIIGNFVHRALVLVKRRFSYVIPDPEELRAVDEELLRRVWSKVEETEELMSEFR